MTSSPRLAVACAAVRRVQANDKYILRDYEVCLVREGGSQEYGFPQGRASLDQEPAKVAVEVLRQATNLTGTNAYPLMTNGKPREAEHVITVLYAIPISNDDAIQVHSSADVQFHSLQDVLENSKGQYSMQSGHRQFLNALDQWLRERHHIPFVRPELVFLCSKEGEGLGGLVRAIIDNPIYSARVRPPEDNLVIALNNPVFQTDGSQVEIDTAVTSHA